ncbi:MAG: hypothetical protein K2N12_04870 [Helicobacter sp.]|nr:hypothetical protein [Helicobacter sp.]
MGAALFAALAFAAQDFLAEAVVVAEWTPLPLAFDLLGEFSKLSQQVADSLVNLPKGRAMFLNNHLASNMLANARITLNSNVKTETNTSVSANNNMSTKLVLGYGVDDDGYFTEDFNKAAGIPEHIKIHSSTMESLYRASVETPQGALRVFSDIDIAKTIGNAYQVLSQLVDEQILNKTSFSKDELVHLPQGYEFDRTTLKVSKIHQDVFEKVNADLSFNYQNKNNQMFASTFYNPVDWSDRHNPKIEPASDIFNSANGGKEDTTIGVFWNTSAEKYTNSDGTISMGGILVAMVNSNGYLKEGKATYMGQMQGYDRNVNPESVQAEHYASWGKSVFDYSDQELNTMSEQRREYIKEMQQLFTKLRAANGYEVQDSARGAYYDSMSNNDDSEYFDPISNIFKDLDKANKEHLERLRKKAIETRQKAQEEARKQAQGSDVDKLYEESNKAIVEFAKLITKLQEESNKNKEPKDQWNVSADSIQKAFINAMNHQNQQAYAPTTKQQVSAFEVEA